MVITLLAVLLAASAPQQPANGIDEAQKPAIDAATAALRANRPDVALATVEPVIAAYRDNLKDEKRRVYCGMSMAEALAYMVSPDAKRGAIAVNPGYCDALYIKGFALIDLERVADARQVYEGLLVLAPLHAHFVTELGQSYRLDGNWPKMLELCKQSATLAELASPNDVNFEKGAAWRCQGYALIEQGKFDEAEALYRQCLALDPNDTKAKNELQYILDQRAKKS